jgi:hypothetical protein
VGAKRKKKKKKKKKKHVGIEESRWVDSWAYSAWSPYVALGGVDFAC